MATIITRSAQRSPAAARMQKQADALDDLLELDDVTHAVTAPHCNQSTSITSASTSRQALDDVDELFTGLATAQRSARGRRNPENAITQLFKSSPTNSPPLHMRMQRQLAEQRETARRNVKASLRIVDDYTRPEPPPPLPKRPLGRPRKRPQPEESTANTSTASSDDRLSPIAVHTRSRQSSHSTAYAMPPSPEPQQHATDEKPTLRRTRMQKQLSNLDDILSEL